MVPISIDPIVDAFARRVAATPLGPMLLSSRRQATFADVDALANAIRDRLTTLTPAALTGLAAPNGPAFIAGFLALRRASVPVLLLDPLAPPEARRRAATAMGAAAIVECDSAWPSSAAEFRLEPAGESTARFESIAVVKLTSGSTGTARGVAMGAEALLADESALAATMGFGAHDRIAAAIPMSHSYGFTTVAMSAMARGLPIVLPSHQGPFASLEASHDLGATVFPTVPSYIGAMLKMAEPPPWPAPIRLVIAAGAVLPASTAAQFRETYGQAVHVFYGSSECGGICYDRDGSAAERGTVGTPVDGVRVSLSAPGEGLVIVESGAVGEAYVPDADPRLQHGRFETRDLATWRDGELALLRRVDDVINVRGHKVDPTEVERVLAALDGVDEVVVLGVPSGDRRELIVRAIVACSSRRLEYQEISAWCRTHLPDHKVPRSVVIVDQIPRTSRGKIDRSALLDIANG